MILNQTCVPVQESGWTPRITAIRGPGPTGAESAAVTTRRHDSPCSETTTLQARWRASEPLPVHTTRQPPFRIPGPSFAGPPRCPFARNAPTP